MSLEATCVVVRRLVDAANSEDLEQAVAAFGQVDGIVNCAGSILLKPAHLTAQQEWEQTMRTNLTTPFAAVRARVKAFGSKAGVIGLTLSAAATYASRNVRVNCVAPGLVDTPLAARIMSNEAAVKASAAMYALGRIGRADEVASGILWFLDPENVWVTGQVLGVDSGLGSVRSR